MKYYEFEELVSYNGIKITDFNQINKILDKNIIVQYFEKHSSCLIYIADVSKLVFNLTVEGYLGDSDFGLLDYREFLKLLKTKMFNKRKIIVDYDVHLGFTADNTYTMHDLMLFFDYSDDV
jgi:hypothetical protein